MANKIFNSSSGEFTSRESEAPLAVSSRAPRDLPGSPGGLSSVPLGTPASNTTAKVEAEKVLDEERIAEVGLHKKGRRIVIIFVVVLILVSIVVGVLILLRNDSDVVPELTKSTDVTNNPQEIESPIESEVAESKVGEDEETESVFVPDLPPSNDVDRDGLTTSEEIENNTDPNRADTDRDGLTDFQEVKVFLTNPLSADTDGDGVGDGEEFLMNTNPGGSGGFEEIEDGDVKDTDGDGLSDVDELVIWGTDPENSDTDGDGVLDGLEVGTGLDPLSDGRIDNDLSKQDSDEDGLSDADEIGLWRTDPENPDTDGDGHYDGDEVEAGYNPLGDGELEADENKKDQDGDNLSDLEEIDLWRTDPENPDTDGDGYYDGDEVEAGYNPLGDGELDADQDEDGLSARDELTLWRTEILNADTDGDGFGDGDEVNSGFNPLGSGRLGDDPYMLDSDGDGLSDGEELDVWLTDPLNYDTDGDGFNDGGEVENGYNPLSESVVQVGQDKDEIKKKEEPLIDEDISSYFISGDLIGCEEKLSSSSSETLVRDGVRGIRYSIFYDCGQNFMINFVVFDPTINSDRDTLVREINKTYELREFKIYKDDNNVFVSQLKDPVYVWGSGNYLLEVKLTGNVDSQKIESVVDQYIEKYQPLNIDIGNSSQTEETLTEGDAVQMSIQNLNFGEPELKIAVGTMVKWTNDDEVIHTVTSDDDVFESGFMTTGTSFEYTFDESGEYGYSCVIHPQMVGKIIVEAGSF